MSWSVSMMGTPEKVAEALEKYGETLSGQSKVEYDAAAPHLAALVRQNYRKSPEYPMVVTIAASGHGMTSGGEDVERCCSLRLEYSYSKILV